MSPSSSGGSSSGPGNRSAATPTATPMGLGSIGRYQLLERIGEGGMGTLYMARDPSIDRLLAIKLLRRGLDSEELRERFAREARAAGRLRHPHIVTVFDVGEHDGDPFIAMEFLPGETIGELVRGGAQLPLTRRLKLLEELCDGLGYAHRSGIVHRDIKPANLMVDAEGSLKILDFGIVRFGESGMTQAGMIVGTVNYMSPEQVMGTTVDARSDIFAVGLVGYELLSYKQAFPGTLADGVFNKILNVTVEPLAAVCPGLDPAVIAIIEQAIARDPASRYQDLGRMRQELSRVRMRHELKAEQEMERSGADAGETMVFTSIGAAAQRGSDSSSSNLPTASLADAERALAAGDFRTALTLAGRSAAVNPQDLMATALVDRAHAALLERGRQADTSQATSAGRPPSGTGTPPPSGSQSRTPEPGSVDATLVAAPMGSAGSGSAPARSSASVTGGTVAAAPAPGGTAVAAARTPASATNRIAIAAIVVLVIGGAVGFVLYSRPSAVPVAPAQSAPSTATEPPPAVVQPSAPATVTEPPAAAAPRAGATLPPLPPVAVDPSARAARPTRPLVVGRDVAAPRRIRNVEPDYPEAARASRTQGTVMLDLTIGPDGRVTNARVAQSVPVLDAAAVAAARQWEFMPTQVNGIAVPVQYSVPVTFALEEQRPAPAPAATPSTPPPPVAPPVRTQEPVREPAPAVTAPTPPPAAVTPPPAAPPPAPARRDPAAEANAVRAILNQYTAAWGALDVNAVRRLHALSDSQADNVRRTMASAKAYQMQIDLDDVQVSADGQRATARGNVSRRFTPRVGSPVQSRTMTTFQLEKRGESWVIVSIG